MPSRFRPWPPYSCGTSRCQRPSFFAFASSVARTSGRMIAPSIDVISIGINSRSTKVRTVSLRSRSSSGNSKSITQLPRRSRDMLNQAVRRVTLTDRTWTRPSPSSASRSSGSRTGRCCTGPRPLRRRSAVSRHAARGVRPQPARARADPRHRHERGAARARRARGARRSPTSCRCCRRSGCRCSSAPRSCRPTSRRSCWPRTRSPSSARRWRW